MEQRQTERLRQEMRREWRRRRKDGWYCIDVVGVKRIDIRQARSLEEEGERERRSKKTREKRENRGERGERGKEKERRRIEPRGRIQSLCDGRDRRE